MLKPVESHTYYWTFIDWGNDEIYDHDFTTKEDAIERAQEIFHEILSWDDHPNGTYFCEPLDLIRYYYRDDNTDREIVERAGSYVEYELIRENY